MNSRSPSTLLLCTSDSGNPLQVNVNDFAVYMSQEFLNLICLHMEFVSATFVR